MSKALRIAIEEIPSSKSMLTSWHPLYFDSTSTPCFREFMVFMQCAAHAKSHPKTLCMDDWKVFMECLEKNGLRIE